MKKARALTIIGLLLVGCERSHQSEVVVENYIHKFGVPITKDDWVLNGHNGQVVQLLTNGVSLTRDYENGVLHGKTTYTFPNSSTIATIETFNCGKLVCKIENYPSGIAKIEEQYKDDTLASKTQWYEDGTPALFETYQSGYLQTGEYHTPLNVVEARVEDGMGLRIVRASDSSLLAKDVIRAGQMVERTTYYANEEPLAITPYENGMIHGTRITFAAGGVPNTVENWIHGKQEGITIVYINGEKSAEVPYVKGEKHGVERRFRDGCDLAEEVSWRQNIQHGPRKIIIDGQDAKTEWYHEGEIVGRTTFERLNLPKSSSHS